MCLPQGAMVGLSYQKSRGAAKEMMPARSEPVEDGKRDAGDDGVKHDGQAAETTGAA
jgi:hypothetical protein